MSTVKAFDQKFSIDEEQKNLIEEFSFFDDWTERYEYLIDLGRKLPEFPSEYQVDEFKLKETVHHWVNDGLMAIFFLVIGLELKREMVNGQLSTFSKILLPGIAAIGGMAIPAVIYLLINMDKPSATPGWAIPTATDIAFSLAVLSVLGNKVPVGLKIFLLSLAIIDDLGAILIIAFFYSGDLTNGQTYSWTFSESQSRVITYICLQHNSMIGTIIISI